MWRKTFDFFSCALVQPVEFFPAASLGDLFVEGKTRHDRSGTVGKKSPPISDISTGPDSKNLALVATVYPLPRKRFCLLTTCFSAPTRLEAASPRGTLARGSDMIEHASWTGDYPVFFPSPSKKTGGAPPRRTISHLREAHLAFPAYPRKMQAVSMRVQAPTFASGVAPAKFGAFSVARFRFFVRFSSRSSNRRRFGPSE